MQPEEQQILAVKYQSAPFFKMDSDELDLWVDALLLKIHAITGWVIPEKTKLIVFTDQLKKKIIESYSTCNPDEIEYAFRQSGTTVKDWGKYMNLSLIDEVMIPYLTKRFEISRIEEQKKLPKNKMEEITDEQMWDTTQALIKKGGYSIDIIPPGLYEWMDDNRNILFNREQKFEYLERATLYRHGKLQMEYEGDVSNRAVKWTLAEFNRMREAKCFEGAEAELIKELAKKMIVFDMMKSAI